MSWSRGGEVFFNVFFFFFEYVRIFPPQFHTNSTHTKNVAAAVRPEAPRPSASEGKAASETGGWRGIIA